MTHGTKVTQRGDELVGFGELVQDGKDLEKLEIKYFTSPVSSVSVSVPVRSVVHAILPSQTRCFQYLPGLTRYGRVLACCEESQPLRTYLVQFAGEKTLIPLREDEFSVRSYLPANDPVDVLACLANETPFFFEYRANFLRELLRQHRLAHGLPALLSSKIDLFPHQLQIADRVLRDPTIRYLLADEVGLGKSIEAGIILRQLALDVPSTKIGVFVPDQLVRQWTTELQQRFDLFSAEVLPHSELGQEAILRGKWDVVVIDEAHRLVSGQKQLSPATAKGLGTIARSARHLLLLSATPVLHNDSDLLALLELLDPENYSIRDIEQFRKRTSRRGEIGRAFLGLQSARLAPMIKLNVKKLADLLPDDFVVQNFANEIVLPGADTVTLRRDLHMHISETYRIHRRMLRTRRRWLAETNKNFIRNVEERNELELDEQPHFSLWSALDEWRIEAAVRAAGRSSLVGVFADAYVRLGEAIAAEPSQLEALVPSVLQMTSATAKEEQLLHELIQPQLAKNIMKARAGLISEILRRRTEHEGTEAKFVVFCASSTVCREIAIALKVRGELSVLKATDRQLNRDEAGKMFSDFATDETRILLTDSIGEEGFNLQFARSLIFQDLPWSPMRIEQRLGRLDRIERAGKILCFDISSGEDETLCLDEAWRRVLTEGFGVFKQSISDLQNLIDAELPHLRECAFFGGPSALIAEISTLAARVTKEREQIEEQDIIDGMHTLSPDTPLCLDLAQADTEADLFGKALTLYLRENLGIRQFWNETESFFTFALPRNREPLIPVDRIHTISEMLNAPATVHRNVAVEAFDLQFLRPGHTAVDACGDLLSWDDRGRAFAMWRCAPGIEHPRPIFRCIVLVRVNLQSVQAALEETAWTPLQRTGLLRLVRGWFPAFTVESFLDENGNSVAPEIVLHCRTGYDRVVDKNLGKESAEFIRTSFGAETWQQWCGVVAKAAVQHIPGCSEFMKQQETAIAQAEDHFQLLRTRLNTRFHAGIDSPTQEKEDLQDVQAIELLVKRILHAPIVELDTIGAYILSSQPFRGPT